MQDLIISKGWFDKKGDESNAPKILCEHRVDTHTVNFEEGIEHCGFCGALGIYNSDTDSLDWKLPEYFTKLGYN